MGEILIIPMTSIITHPLRNELQQRLEKLKAGIIQKKDEAKKLFQTVMEQFRIRELGVIVPDDIKKHLSVIKNILLLAIPGSHNTTEKIPQEASLEKLELANILQAIQSLSTPPSEKSAILSMQLEEELKKRLALQFSEKNIQLTADWKSQVKPSDIAAVLGSSQYANVTQKFGGPVGMLEKSMELSQNFAGVLNKLSKQDLSPQDVAQTMLKPVGPSR